MFSCFRKVEVCLLLLYVLKDGKNDNSEQDKNSWNTTWKVFNANIVCLLSSSLGQENTELIKNGRVFCSICDQHKGHIGRRLTGCSEGYVAMVSFSLTFLTLVTLHCYGLPSMRNN